MAAPKNLISWNFSHKMCPRGNKIIYLLKKKLVFLSGQFRQIALFIDFAVVLVAFRIQVMVEQFL